MLYRLSLYLLLASVFSGCMTSAYVITGIDYLCTQSPKPIEGRYKMTLSNSDNGDSLTYIAEIEHYYEMKGVRGNRWIIRYKGGNDPAPFKTTTLDGLPIEVPFPSFSHLPDCSSCKTYSPIYVHMTSMGGKAAYRDSTGRYSTQGQKENAFDLNLYLEIEKLGPGSNAGNTFV